MTTTTPTPTLADMDRLIERGTNIAGWIDKFGAKADAVDVLQLVALARRAAQPVALVQDVLTIPTAIMDISADARQSDEYKRGHRDARHAAADLVLARADELKALATPSPQVAEGAELLPLSAGLPSPDEHHRVLVYTDGVDFAGQQYFDIRAEDLWQRAVEDSNEIVEAATHWMPLPRPGHVIAASRRAAGGDIEIIKAFERELANDPEAYTRPGEVVYTVTQKELLRFVRNLPAPASAGQAAPADLASIRFAAVDGMERALNYFKGKGLHDFDTDKIAERFLAIRNAVDSLAAQPAEGAGQAGQVDWQARALRAEELLKQFAKDGDDLCKKLDAPVATPALDVEGSTGREQLIAELNEASQNGYPGCAKIAKALATPIPVADRKLDVEAEPACFKAYLAELHPDAPPTGWDCWLAAKRDLIAAQSTAPVSTEQAGGAWISVEDRLPECSSKENSLGVEVIIWPPLDDGREQTAFFGKRVTREPWFYKYGEILHVTHWMPLPAAPSPNNSPVGADRRE